MAGPINIEIACLGLQNVILIADLSVCDLDSETLLYTFLLQALWFPLLDALMFPQRRIKDIDNKEVLTGGLQGIIRNLLLI